MKNLILIFVMAFAMSCNLEKYCNLPEQIIGTGEIVSNALVSHPLTTWEMSHYEHIIRADSQNVFNLTVSFDNGLTFGDIDFNQYTLLGKFARGGCHVTFERNVTRCDAQKSYFYEIKVHQCGTCQSNWESMNWVLVPKIPDDYNVSFMVLNKKY